MKNRLFKIVLLLVTSLILVSCAEKKPDINLIVSSKSVILNVEQTYKIEVETDDQEGVSYETSNNSIVTVDNEGVVTALGLGTAEVTVRSKSNEKVFETISFDVVDFEVLNYVLAEGMTILIEDDLLQYEYEIDNTFVAKINENNQIEAVFSGETQIVFKEDGITKVAYNIKVMAKPTSIELSGPTTIYTNEDAEFVHRVRPANSFDLVEYVVEDEDILQVVNGKFIPVGIGTTTITVKSLQSDDIFDSIEITVKEVIVVSKSENSLKLGNWEYRLNVDLFKSIEDAIEAADSSTKILVLEGTYDESINITKDVVIEGNNGIIVGDVLLNSANITLDNLIFKDQANIVGGSQLKNFSFTNNTVENIENENFISLSKYETLNISENTFKNISNDVIELFDIDNRSESLIENNTIENAKTAIKISAQERMERNSGIRIYRNTISDIETGLYIDLNGKNDPSRGELYARFNQISDYNKAVINNDDNNFDFTFNYWGKAQLNISDFDNVNEKYLLESYTKSDDILSEEDYRYKHPIVVRVDNIIDVIELGETYKLEPVLLPYNSSLENMQLFVNDESILKMSRTYDLTPVKSGLVEIVASPLLSRTNQKVYEVEVTTDPGIHFEIDNPTYNLEVGNEINITAKPFPYNFANEKVFFSSSNTNIATVDGDGKVKIVGVGLFTITAKVTNPVVIEETLEFESVNEFDEFDIMDFITQKQQTYSKVHEITLWGVTIADVIQSESVTRISPAGFEIKEDIIDVTPGFRPGTKMNSTLPEEYKFNDENIVWVVIHDTANSNVGAGAELHARYLRGQAENNGRQASWHYTIDHIEAYRHLPEDEVAYHAGDGSALPGLERVSPSLGGGNRNGIGIETSIQRDAHMFRVWANAASLAADLLVKYNLPLAHQRYHQDYSGKACPNTLIRAGLIPYFEELVENEYNFRHIFGSSVKSIELVSNNPDILNNEGTIIKTPNRTTQVSYDILVTTSDNQIVKKTFTTLVEGLWK